MRNYTWTKGSVAPEDRILRKLFAAYGPLNPDACWIWPGATGKGYGMVKIGSRRDGSRRNKNTHIVMWEAANGPTPEGKELHHRCMTPLCCNPTHLKPVTHQVNSILVMPETTERRRMHMAENQKLRWV